MKGMSDVKPERIVKGRDIAHYNYNIKEIEVEDIDGTTRTAYSYNYVVIEGKLTKAKVIKALEDRKLDISEPCNPEELEIDYNAAIGAIENANLANLTYAELDTYINNNVTNLKEAKAYLKKLSKVVLAILKYLNIK